ncbi:hypothetical protein KIN20_037090 [Parelaphostrongylus tenuis]|uniref:Histone-lysine N-methyltransferase SETD2 n=1 Tax=Parelaphostrongylus tenuis TaxID=148309 RepID=A0AAD5WLQ8_PARTN|nr:hypothetical protein KIN20_037090 [Parelaphostrongylus tenuis]
MDGSPCTGDAHSVVVNHSGYDDDEIQNLMEIGSEDDEESPPQLVFTDGSCSDTNSQHSDGIFSSPDGRSELCPSPAFQNCIPGEADENKISMDEVVSIDPKSPLDDNMEVVFSQGISGEEHKNLGSYAYSVDTESQVDPALEKNDALIAVAPCTSCSPDLDRDEVDMEVSSGDESDNCTDRAREQNSAVTFQTPEKSQPTLEEKKRIEENIEALMKDFERKRFEEKVRRAAEVVAKFLKQRPTVDMVSTTSELSPVVYEANSTSSEQNSAAVLGVQNVASGPAMTPHSVCTDPNYQQKSSWDESQSRIVEKEDNGFELPSSSADVPPVPHYEEIEQCIYRVETKRIAESLMCFCRSNNLDCSDARCDNRSMFTECPKNCLGKKKKCKNRRFARREYAAVQAFYTGPSKGFGVQAIAPIKKGQFIIEYVGEVVSSEEFAKRLKKYGRDPSHTHHYMFEIGSLIIDATKKGNCSRFMNHSCEPNAVCEKWYVPKTPGAIDRIGFFAKRDIEIGEEITFDYQFENYGREAQRCFCGATTCSGWIGKPPELLDDDSVEEETETESDTEESADEDMKSAERILPRLKKSHRYSENVFVTASEIEERLTKALRIGCRNKTHVLSWMKLMTEMTLVKREYGVVRSMCQIVEAVSSVDTSLQHIFVANGLPNIFKSWLRTACPETMTRDDLNLKQCIIRSLLAMQSCAEAINARAPDLLTVVSDLVSMPCPDSLCVIDVVDEILFRISRRGHPSEPECFHESLELRFERVRSAAVRLQTVLQQHVNFRIPKKKAKGSPKRSSDQHSRNDDHQDSGYCHNQKSSLRENGEQNEHASLMSNRLNVVVGKKKTRKRASRWSIDYELRKRSPSYEPIFRHRIDPLMTGPPLSISGFDQSSQGIYLDEEPMVVPVMSSWRQPTVPAIIPPPPPPPLLSSSQIMAAPPPPTLPPAFPGVIPFYEYGPYAPPIPNLPDYQPYECSPVGGIFDSDDCRKFYKNWDTPSIKRQLQNLTREVSILQSILEERTEENEVEPPVLPAPQPPAAKTPPPPPPHKEYLWKKAVDEDGAKYYYHKETRESVWELPEGEESDPGERTPTRMPDTSGCGNDPELENVESSMQNEGSNLSRWASVCSPQVSTSSALPSVQSASSVNGFSQISENKRDRDRRIWERFGTDIDRKRAKKLMSDIEKVVGPIIMRCLAHRSDATKKRKEWIIKQVSKEMLKRESERPDFNFMLTEKGSKRVTDYANAFIQRKCAKEPKDLWKGYEGSP